MAPFMSHGKPHSSHRQSHRTTFSHHFKEATERRASNSAGHRQERHSKVATGRRGGSSGRHRQGVSDRFLKGVSQPIIAKHHQGSRASHPPHGSAGAVGKGPGSAAASGQAAVRMSKAELRRNASLDKWVATATTEDKLARRVNVDYSDANEPAAQPAQQRARLPKQRAQPPAKVFSVPAMKKRKVATATLCAGFDWHS